MSFPVDAFHKTESYAFVSEIPIQMEEQYTEVGTGKIPSVKPCFEFKNSNKHWMKWWIPFPTLNRMAYPVQQIPN